MWIINNELSIEAFENSMKIIMEDEDTKENI